MFAVAPYIRCSYEESGCEELLLFDNGTLVEDWVQIMACGNEPSIDHTMGTGGYSSCTFKSLI